MTLLPPNQDPEIAVKRTSFVDVLCKDIKGTHFIIEMQVAYEPGFEKRAQYYAAKTYITQRDKTTNYNDLKEVIFLAIVDFTLFPNQEGYLSHHHILNTKTYKRNIKGFSFSFLELGKFMKTKGQLSTSIEKWAYFFKHAWETTKDDLAQVTGGDPAITNFPEEFKPIWMDETRTAVIRFSRDAGRSGSSPSCKARVEKGRQRVKLSDVQRVKLSDLQRVKPSDLQRVK